MRISRFHKVSKESWEWNSHQLLLYCYCLKSSDLPQGVGRTLEQTKLVQFQISKDWSKWNWMLPKKMMLSIDIKKTITKDFKHQLLCVLSKKFGLIHSNGYLVIEPYLVWGLWRIFWGKININHDMISNFKVKIKMDLISKITFIIRFPLLSTTLLLKFLFNFEQSLVRVE